MDSICFLDNDSGRVNVISVTIANKINVDDIRERFRKLMKLLPRTTYSVRE